MDAQFRSLTNDAVMCTVEGCQEVATVLFSGRAERSPGGRSVVEAYCHGHADGVKARLSRRRALADRVTEGQRALTRVFRAS